MIGEKELTETQLEGNLSNHELLSRYGFFHENIAEYFNRQWRAFTCPRMALWWFGSFTFFNWTLYSVGNTFYNINQYQKLSDHPNYKALGAFRTNFYLLRPVLAGWACYKMTLGLYSMLYNHYFLGRDDLHYFWYYDSLYPDMYHDADDMRYLNFMYSDNRVSPDAMNGYFPEDDVKYTPWLKKKFDRTD